MTKTMLKQSVPEMTKEEKRSIVIEFLRKKWKFAHKQGDGPYKMQMQLIEELASLIPSVKMAEIDVASSAYVSPEKYALICFFAGLLDFKSGVINRNMVELDYRATIFEIGDRVTCGRRFGFLLGLEPRASQLQHKADVTGIVIL